MNPCRGRAPGSIGVEGKHLLWQSLKTVEDAYPSLVEFDLDGLIARARDQRQRIEAKRLELAPQALAHTVKV